MTDPERVFEALMTLDDVENEYRRRGIDESYIDDLSYSVLSNISKRINEGVITEASFSSIISQIIAWLKSAAARIVSMMVSDVKFIEKYEDLLRANARNLNEIEFEMPTIKDPKLLSHFPLKRANMFEFNVPMLKAIHERIKKAESEINIKQTTTIGEQGGIFAIIKTMKRYLEYERNGFIDQLNQMDSIRLDVNYNRTGITFKPDLWAKACKALISYRLQCAAARHKAYKEALIKAIGVCKRTKTEAIIAAVEASNHLCDKYIYIVKEVFSDDIISNANGTSGIENVSKAGTGVLPNRRENPDKLVYDKVDSYAQSDIGSEKIAGYVGTNVTDGYPNHTRIMAGDPTPQVSESYMSDYDIY